MSEKRSRARCVVSNPASPPGEIRVGFCHPARSLRLENGPGWTAYNFAISQDTVSESRILDSCVSPPSRYLFEMVHRIRSSTIRPDSFLLIFNPLLLLTEDEVRLTLAMARG